MEQDLPQKGEMLQNQLIDKSSGTKLYAPLDNNSFSQSNFSKKGLLIKIFLFLFFLIFISASVVLLLPLFSHEPAEPVTITYWGANEDREAMHKIFTDFMKENPNITVNYEDQDLIKYRPKLSTRISVGKGPDVFRFHNSWVPMFKNVLLPIPSDVFNPTELKDLYPPVVRKDLYLNRTLIGLPISMETLVLFVNKQILDAAGVAIPRDWQDDFINAARVLTVKDEEGRIKTSGAAFGTFDNINHASEIVALLLAQNHVDLDKISQAPDRVSEALVFYTSFAKGQNSVWDDTLDPSLLAFAKENLAMYIGYPSDLIEIKRQNPNLDVIIAPVPQLSSEKNLQKNIASYWVIGVSNNTKYPKEAMMLMKYLIKREVIEKRFAETATRQIFGEPYARLDMTEQLKNNEYLSVSIEQMPTATSTFFIKGIDDEGINSFMNASIKNAINASLNGQVEQATKTFIQDVQKIYQQYGI